ncbi:MAG: energy-coupled thiamine transporter ThiT [Coriobacteriaceae bacterium]|nr:energy-coupled thiamine transporter ThiT [Coriobacteriaceae bacterium]
MKKERLVTLVEMALAIALGAVLNYMSVRLPIHIAGGSISLDMLPIIVIALRRGPVAGVVTGALYGFVNLAMGPYIVHPAQVVLDYPLAFGLVGLAGLLPSRPDAGDMAVARAPIGAVVGGLARLASHYVSGVVFFGANAPEGQPVWLYSLVYNATYMLPSIVACAVAAAIVVPVLDRTVPARSARG